MAEPRRHPRPIPENEKGFVLIAAVWLLVLAGAIVALMMLRGMTEAREARSEGELLRHKLALDGAVETVVADRLFNGPRSPWSRVQAQGSLDIDGTAVQVRSTSENGRLDFNATELATVDRALQGLGVGAGNRRVVLGRMQQLRRRDERLSSFAALEALLSQAQKDTSVCLADMMTLDSGLPQPRAGQMPDKLAFALAMVDGSEAAGGELLQGGEVQRLEMSTSLGMAHTTILRPIGQNRKAKMVTAAFPALLCR